MKIFRSVMILASLLLAKANVAQVISFPPSGENQKSMVTQYVGLVAVTVTYSRPNVTGPNGEDRRGKIWGGVVPYGDDLPVPWRAGANERTIVEFSHDVMVDNQLLKAGKYGLLIYVNQNAPWTLIFSKDYLGWGGFSYKKENDALRIKVNPVEADYCEWLTYGFDDSYVDNTTLYMKWETKKIQFNIKVPDYTKLYVDHFKESLKKSPLFYYPENWQWAADFCVKNNVNLEDALKWANYSMVIGEVTFSRIATKASVLSKMGRQPEADAEMDKAIGISTATVNNVVGYARTLLNEGRMDRALKVFNLAYSNFKNDKFLTSRGLADYYAKANDAKNEMKYLKEAIGSAPKEQAIALSELNDRLSKLNSK